MPEDKIYKLIFENTQSTVVAEYQPEYRTETSYQTEAELEKAFIKRLQEQGYEYLSIKKAKQTLLTTFVGVLKNSTTSPLPIPNGINFSKPK